MMKTYFKALQEEILHAYESSRLLGHSLEKGHEREVITTRFLERHMPQFVETGQGVIVDQDTIDFSRLKQTNSPQIDILLAMTHHPSLTFYGGTKFFFAESVAAVIEVKSRLTTSGSSSELQKVLKHCYKVKQRTRQMLGLYHGKRPSTKVPYYVVAFETDSGAEELINKLRDIGNKEGLTSEQRLTFQPDGIFVLDPNNSVGVLKHIDDHEIRPADYSDSCFASGYFPDGGVLLGLWLTLFNQINCIRLLQFPSASYAKRVLQFQEDSNE